MGGLASCCLSRERLSGLAPEFPQQASTAEQHGDGGGASASGGPRCSCSAFQANGCCRHLPPSLGGVEVPLVQQSSKVEEDDAPKRTVVVDAARIAWYRQEGKSLRAARGSKCGVFLDVDGVVHPLGAYGKESFCHLPLLLQILSGTNCDVVLSSSWRMDDEGTQEINDRLREARGGGPEVELLDITPATRGPLNELGNRDKEILQWMNVHASEVGWGQRWIALDDLDLTEALGEAHAVVTKSDDGLTLEKVREAISKLKASG